jgi:serine/threonine protein kinase
MIKILLDITRGLFDLHCKGLVHKDLKPENVVVDIESVKAGIIDLDFCSPVKDIKKLSKSTGSYAYLSPERVLLLSLEGDHPFTKLKGLLESFEEKTLLTQFNGAIDRWALGCILFIYKNKRLPCCSKNIKEIERNQLEIFEIEEEIALNMKQFGNSQKYARLWIQLQNKKNNTKEEINKLLKKYEDNLIELENSFVSPDLESDFFGGLATLLLRVRPSDRLDIESLLKIVEDYAKKIGVT